MKTIFRKSLKYVLLSHIIIFILLLLCIGFVAIMRNDFYMFDERMPWQETFLNLPLKWLLSINLIFYWTKFSALYFMIVLLISNFKIKRGDLLLMIAVVIIYLLIKTGIFHYFANFVLHGYDCNAPSLNPVYYMFF